VWDSKIRDWDRLIDVGEAAAGWGGRQRGWVAESILSGTSCIFST